MTRELSNMFRALGGPAITFRRDDGGRAAAGFQGSTGDCCCRAIAIAAQRPYADVYAELADVSAATPMQKRERRRSHPRTGMRRDIVRRYLEARGWRWVPLMGIGTGCTVHLRADELPPGRLIVSLSKHYAAVIDGVLHDTHDCSRDGTRCVYGYFQQVAA